MAVEPDTETLRDKINLETGRVAWAELERHFARGALVRVAGELDLVEVAQRFALDDKAAVQAWMEEGAVAVAEAGDAQRWSAERPEFWAVVVAPWVLVQEIRGHG